MLEDLNPAHAYRKPVLSLWFSVQGKNMGKPRSLLPSSLLLRRTEIIVVILLKPSTLNEPVEKKSS